MIRAIVRDRRGDVISEVRSFQNQAELDRYTESVVAELSRRGQKIETLPASPLTDDQQAQLAHLQHFAGQANGIMKTFIVDADMARRKKNRVPTAKDIKLFADAMRAAADQFEDLSIQEFGLADKKVAA